MSSPAATPHPRRFDASPALIRVLTGGFSLAGIWVYDGAAHHAPPLGRRSPRRPRRAGPPLLHARPGRRRAAAPRRAPATARSHQGRDVAALRCRVGGRRPVVVLAGDLRPRTAAAAARARSVLRRHRVRGHQVADAAPALCGAEAAACRDRRRRPFRSRPRGTRGAVGAGSGAARNAASHGRRSPTGSSSPCGRTALCAGATVGPATCPSGPTCTRTFARHDDPEPADRRLGARHAELDAVL